MTKSIFTLSGLCKMIYNDFTEADMKGASVALVGRDAGRPGLQAGGRLDQHLPANADGSQQQRGRKRRPHLHCQLAVTIFGADFSR